MIHSIKIKKVHAREVLDSRGFPTVEADLVFQTKDQELVASAIVPSGASTGEHEALELRDDDPKRFLGKGVKKAVGHVLEKIAPAVSGREFARQSIFDDTLKEIDGTPNKSNLGANAILAVSMAFAKAQALSAKTPLFKSIASVYECPGVTLPLPLMNIVNGGKHADNGLDLQELMIAPVGLPTFKEALRAGAEVFHHLKKILKKSGLATSVGDEGGFAPVFTNSSTSIHEQALDLILQSIHSAGYEAGSDIFLALDSASSEFCDSKTGDFVYKFEGRMLNAREMTDVYAKWIEKYPILSIEDGLAENDWKGWQYMTSLLGKKCQLVGDDLFVTNVKFLKKGIEEKAANAILIKLNQIGTVTETLETMKLAMKSGYRTVISHRSGESEDSFIADLAVGTDSGQIKTGSLSRSDRIAKYNQLLRIEETLGDKAKYQGKPK